MGRSVNQVQLLGNLGNDAATKYTSNGVPITRFSVATERRFKSNDEWKTETDWHNITLWSNEKLAGYLTKGTKVFVQGRLHTRATEDKETGRKMYFTEVVAQDIVLCGGGGGNGGSRPEQTDPVVAEIVEDESVPF